MMKRSLGEVAALLSNHMNSKYCVLIPAVAQSASRGRQTTLSGGWWCYPILR